jgi:FkbM family methyltransferase
MHALTMRTRPGSLVEAELIQELGEILRGEDPERARLLDAVMFERLVLGRVPDTDALPADPRTDGVSRRDFLLANLPGDAAQRAYPHVPCVARELMWEREDGLRIFFNLCDLAVGMQITQGTFDPEVEAVITHLVQPGSVCLDIGANLGLYTLVMARAGARVRAFEAFPYNHHLLERNVAENRLDHRVVTHLVGCSDGGGVGRVCVDETSANLGSGFVLIGDGEAPAGHVVREIPLARVDDLVPASERVGLVKIDVEGAELDVLRGMDRILGRDRPVVVMELNTFTLRRNRGVEAEDLLGHLFARGYRAAEAASLLTSDPVWVRDIPRGADVFANIVAWCEDAPEA